jgi:amidohydrolase
MKQHHLEIITQLRHRLHELAELSMHEVRTKKHLMDFLTRTTSLQVVDCDSWFYAYYYAGDDRPTVAFRADFDALPMDEDIDVPYASETPGVSHKCGHDGHSAILAGTALEINADGAPNNIVFLFQPGEETGEGAVQCLGIFDAFDIDEFYALHNFPTLPLNMIGGRSGATNCASTGLRLDFTGTPSHASLPEDGRNPSLAIAETISSLPGTFDQSKYTDLVMCTVVHVQIGEKSFGVSPGEGSLWLTCRGARQSEMEAAISSTLAVAEARAAAHQLSLTVSYHETFPENASHAQCVQAVREACGRCGTQFMELPSAARGSEDFGHFLHKAPGAMFVIGGGDIPQIHTAGYDFPDGILETAVNVFLELCRDGNVKERRKFTL